MKALLRSHYTPYCSVCSHGRLGGWKSFINFFLNVVWKKRKREKASAPLSVFAAVNFLWCIFHDESSWLSTQTVALLQETQMSCSNSFPLRDYGIFSLPDICKACLSLHKQLSTLHFPKPSSSSHSICAILPEGTIQKGSNILSFFKVNESAI